jgi:SAM-dependent methyltransferase
MASKDMEMTTGASQKSERKRMAAADAAEMIEINSEQAKFYDSISIEDDKSEQTGYARHEKANALTRVWAALRYRQQEAFAESGLEEKKKDFHQRWIDKKAGGNFLELGCFRGTRSSWPLIEGAGRYVGIDLSANAIAVLNKKIEAAGLSKKANAVAGDFLIMDESAKYDMVFAHGVLHHFKNPRPMFEKISNILKDDGILLLTEPSQIHPLYGSIRRVYRPFQSDSDWEWPFTQRTVSIMEEYLTPKDGFGWGKSSLMIGYLNSVPVLGKFSRPVYLRMLQREIDAGWSQGVWLNPAVTAVYAKRPQV